MSLIKKIQIFGDSLMKGVILDTASNHYITDASNVAKFGEQFALEINNRSRFGCTITKGSQIMNRELQKGVDCQVALLEYGGNDCDFNWEEVAAHPEHEHFPHTPLAVFEQTYCQMIETLRSYGIIPIVMSLPPIDSIKYFHWFCRKGLDQERILHWLGDVELIYRHQELYSLAATKVAMKMKTLYVDVRSAFLDRHNFKELLCDDGIHPSSKGQVLIRDVFTNFANGFKSEYGLVI